MLLSKIPKVPFLDQLPSDIRFKDNSKRSIKSFERLIKDTKSYVFTPLEDEFEKESQDNIRRIESLYSGDVEEVYSQIQALRQTERKEMISKGYLDDENSKRSLDNAIAFRGTCQEMCPPFERLRRTRQNNVNVNEKNPMTNKIDPTRAVKSFARPAAGQEPPLPSDVRPPEVLVNTLSYLVNNLLDKMPETQSFIWDRTRLIRQDFTFQNYFGPETIDCNEKIARIHIYSLHIMAANPHIEYSQQQEMEQLEKSLKTLCDMYSEYRNKGFPQPPNEAEFRAYFLVLKFQDSDLERITLSLPTHIFEDARIQWALYVRRCISTKKLKNSLQVYTTFFKTVIDNPDFPFLLLCLLETKFNDIRLHAMKAIFKSVHSKYKNLTLQHLMDALNFQSKEKLKEYLKFYSITYVYNSDNAEETIDMKSIPKFFNKLANDEDRKIMKSAYDSRLENKIVGRSKSDIINNGYPNDFIIDGTSVNNDTFEPTVDFTEIKRKQKQLQEHQMKLIEQNSKKERLRQSILQKQESLKKEKEQQAEKQKFEELKKQRQIEQQRELEQQESLRREEAERKLREEKLKIKEEELKRKQEEVERIRFLEKQELEKQKLQKLKEEEQKRQKKELAINKLSNQLFKGFLDEIVYLTILKAMADNFRSKTLKQFATRRLLESSKKVQYKLKIRKLEKHETSRTLKSLGVDANVDYHSKRASILNDHLEKNYRETTRGFKGATDAESGFNSTQYQININKKSHETAGIWKPLDLSIFCDLCSQNLDTSVRNINCLMYAKNWRSSSGRWLASKFLLIPNSNLFTYGSHVTNNKLLVNFVGITKHLNESFLKDTAFIIFECGFTSKDILELNYQEKLAKDGEKLLELSNELSEKSDFKFQIVLLYWANTKISELEVYNCLNIDRIKSSLKGNLYDIVFCSLKSSVMADYQLQKSLRKVGKHFKGIKSSKYINSEGDKHEDSRIQNDMVFTSGPQRKLVAPDADRQKENHDVSEKREQVKRAMEHEKSLVENHPYFKKYMNGNNSLYWSSGMHTRNTSSSSFLMPSSSNKKRRILSDDSFHSLRGTL